MAEALGLVASVIQVAGTGLKLSQTLYHYIDGVASADRRVKDIAKEIELTSFVIQELAAVFGDDDTSMFISKNAVKTANETIKECSTVFAEIEVTLHKSKKNTLGRLMLPFRDNKIELLRTHIDKLKSTLQLLMQVLTHAHQVASKKLDREAERKQREDIKELLENKKRSTKRYEESLKAYSITSHATTVIDSGSDEEKNISMTTVGLTVAASSVTSTINAETLGKCVQHVRNLLQDIEILQRAFASQADGEDHSNHHQNVLGSYFRARDHLDGILFGITKDPNFPGAQSAAYNTNLEARADTGIHRSMTGSTLNHKISHTALLADTDISTLADKVQGESKANQIIGKLMAEKEALIREAEEDKERYKTEMEADRLSTDLQLGHVDKISAKLSSSERVAPLTFKDSLGRNYTIPFQLCSTWQGMLDVVKQVYLHDEKWAKHIADGTFNLKDMDGNVILPAYWSSIIEPGVTVTLDLCSTNEAFDTNLNLPDTSHSSTHSPLIAGQDSKKSKKIALKPDLYDTVAPPPEQIKQVQEEIDATMAMMRKDIHKVLDNGERLDSLQDSSDTLALATQGFRRGAGRQRSHGLWGSVQTWFGAPFGQGSLENTSTVPGSSSSALALFDSGFDDELQSTTPVHATFPGALASPNLPSPFNDNVSPVSLPQSQVISPRPPPPPLEFRRSCVNPSLEIAPTTKIPLTSEPTSSLSHLHDEMKLHPSLQQSISHSETGESTVHDSHLFSTRMNDEEEEEEEEEEQAKTTHLEETEELLDMDEQTPDNEPSRKTIVMESDEVDDLLREWTTILG